MRVAAALVISAMLANFEPLNAQESQPSTPACYALEVGEWQPPRLEGNEPYQSPPLRFMLHDSTGTSVFERGKKVVRPVIPHGRTPSAFWEQIGSDSVRVMWTNGFAGVTMRLEIVPEGLRGTARAFTDVRIEGKKDPTAAVAAEAIECDTLIRT